MTRTFASLAALPLVLPIAIAITAASNSTHPGAGSTASQSNLIVHEWGTFTSIASQDGTAEPWTPLAGRTDLPCFVHRTQDLAPKHALIARVRMETPVIYFYGAGHVGRLDVNVGFREGLITEYFPRAAVGGDRWMAPSSASSVRWPVVAIESRHGPLPTERGANHYYDARDVDANDVSAGGERDRFLFYRGVGGFALPLQAIARDTTVDVTNDGAAPISFVMLFEHRAGRAGFVVHRTLRGTASLQRPALDLPAAQARGALERALVDEGLYPREAAAMVATWDDTWFEEGSRLFYIVPRRRVDEVLPLTIQPAPRTITRVFVGRLELATNETLAGVRDALLTGTDAEVDRYGRFLQPFASRVITGGLTHEQRATAIRRRDAATLRLLAAARGDCASTTTAAATPGLSAR